MLTGQETTGSPAFALLLPAIGSSVNSRMAAIPKSAKPGKSNAAAIEIKVATPEIKIMSHRDEQWCTDMCSSPYDLRKETGISECLLKNIYIEKWQIRHINQAWSCKRSFPLGLCQNNIILELFWSKPLTTVYSRLPSPNSACSKALLPLNISFSPRILLWAPWRSCLGSTVLPLLRILEPAQTRKACVVLIIVLTTTSSSTSTSTNHN